MVPNAVCGASIRNSINLLKQSSSRMICGGPYGSWWVSPSTVKGFSCILTRKHPFIFNPSTHTLSKLPLSLSTNSITIHPHIFHFSSFSIEFLLFLLIFFTFTANLLQISLFLPSFSHILPIFIPPTSTTILQLPFLQILSIFHISSHFTLIFTLIFLPNFLSIFTLVVI